MLGLRITSYSHVGGRMLVELMWVSFKQRQVLNKYVEHKWSRMQLELVSICIYIRYTVIYVWYVYLRLIWSIWYILLSYTLAWIAPWVFLFLKANRLVRLSQDKEVPKLPSASGMVRDMLHSMWTSWRRLHFRTCWIYCIEYSDLMWYADISWHILTHFLSTFGNLLDSQFLDVLWTLFVEVSLKCDMMTCLRCADLLRLEKPLLKAWQRAKLVTQTLRKAAAM